MKTAQEKQGYRLNERPTCGTCANLTEPSCDDDGIPPWPWECKIGRFPVDRFRGLCCLHEWRK